MRSRRPFFWKRYHIAMADQPTTSMNIPQEIIDAARKIALWADTNDIRYWQIMGVCDGRFAKDNEELKLRIKWEINPDWVTVENPTMGFAKLNKDGKWEFGEMPHPLPPPPHLDGDGWQQRGE